MVVDAQLITLIGQLGIAAPLIGILIMLLKSADSERREITTKFLATLETTIKSSSESAALTTHAISEVTRTTTERNTESAAQHGRMIELLLEISRELSAVKEQHPA